MSVTRVQGRIGAPAKTVYGILADYRVHHPRVLPKMAFLGIEVLHGGVGEGTVMDVRMKTPRGEQRLRLTATEPEPGRVLVESAPDGTVTRFTVEPAGESACDVTIETTWPDRRWFRDRITGMVYRKELRLLDEYATSLAP